MKVNISHMPVAPSVLKFTAHGYINITSTSKSTKSIATKKYLTETGVRALPSTSIPHSKVSSLIFVLRFGPNKCVTNMVLTTKPAATKNMRKMGTKSAALLSVIICFLKPHKFKVFLELKRGFFWRKKGLHHYL